MRQSKACIAKQLLTDLAAVWTVDGECPDGSSTTPCGSIRVLHDQGRCTFCSFPFVFLGCGPDYGFFGRTHCAPQKYGDGVERYIRSHYRFSLCHQRLICRRVPRRLSLDTAGFDWRGLLAVRHRLVLDSPSRQAPREQAWAV